MVKLSVEAQRRFGDVIQAVVYNEELMKDIFLSSSVLRKEWKDHLMFCVDSYLSNGECQKSVWEGLQLEDNLEQVCDNFIENDDICYRDSAYVRYSLLEYFAGEGIVSEKAEFNEASLVSLFRQNTNYYYQNFFSDWFGLNMNFFGRNVRFLVEEEAAG